MKLVAKKYVLLALADKAFAVAAKTSTTPILQGVLFSAEENNSLTAVGSDGELTMVSRTDQTVVEEAGSCLFPPRFHELLKHCEDEDVEIVVDDARLAVVKCADANWDIRLEAHDDYPVTPDFPENLIYLPKDSLSDALEKCRPAMGSDNVLSMYMFVELKDGVMRATDGAKFHQANFEFPIDYALLPARATQEVVRRTKAMAMDEVAMGEGEGFYAFRFDEDILFANKHVTRYPDVADAMLRPTVAYEHSFSVKVKSFIVAVKRAAITVDEDTNFLSLELTGNRLRLHTRDKFANQSTEDIDIFWPGEERQLGVNINFLLDVLSALSQPECEVFIGPDDPPKYTMLRFQEDNFVGVLMQLRQDLGDAAKGSTRVRAARSEPVGWGHRGVTAEQVAKADEDPKPKRRGRKPKQEPVSESDTLEAEAAQDVLEDGEDPHA